MSDNSEEFGAKFSFAFSAEIGKLTDELQKDRLDRIRAAKENTPKLFRRQSAVVIPTPSVPTGFGLGGPTAGYIWELRTLSIGGQNWSTTAAGTAEVYSTANDSALMAQVRDLTELVDQASGSTPALPSVAGYSAGQISLQFPEKLQVVIVGGTAGQQYLCGAYWREYPTIPYVSTIDQ